jgi:hypothetical protein
MDDANTVVESSALTQLVSDTPQVSALLRGLNGGDSLQEALNDRLYPDRYQPKFSDRVIRQSPFIPVSSCSST